MPERVRVVIGDAAVRALSSSDEMRDLLLDLAEPVVREAKAGAPRKTGAGAASIRSEPVRDEFGHWTVRVSWGRDFYYMYFHERGWERNPGRDFLEQALERAIR